MQQASIGNGTSVFNPLFTQRRHSLMKKLLSIRLCSCWHVLKELRCLIQMCRGNHNLRISFFLPLKENQKSPITSLLSQVENYSSLSFFSFCWQKGLLSSFLLSSHTFLFQVYYTFPNSCLSRWLIRTSLNKLFFSCLDI